MGRDSRRFFTARQVRQLLIASDCQCEICGRDLTGQPFHAHHVRSHAEGQQDCFKRFQEVLRSGERRFIFEACMGAGKSAMAAMIAKSFTDYLDASTHRHGSTNESCVDSLVDVCRCVHGWRSLAASAAARVFACSAMILR